MAETEKLEENLRIKGREVGADRAPSQPATRTWRRYTGFAAVALVVLLFAGIRWRVREMPLERDEGEYAYAGQLILQGIPPYQLAYNMKLPGTYAAYAAILRTLGETAAGIHLGVLIINALTTAMLFFLARRLYGDLPGVICAASYGLLSTGEGVLGLAGHATHFVVFFAVVGLLFLIAARKSHDLQMYFVAGLCMGLAFLMKQPGAIFVLFGAQEIAGRAWTDKNERKKVSAGLGLYGVGAAIPYLLTGLALYRAGVFAKFWFWTVSYAGQYATSTTVPQALRYLREVIPELFFGAPVVWCLAAAGLFALLGQRGKSALLGFEISLLVWSLLGASAGLYYRNHYFILMLPAVCLLAGWAVSWSIELAGAPMSQRRRVAIVVIIFALAWTQALYAQRAVFFQMSPENIVRSQYPGNPFPEAVEFGKYIKAHSEPGARVAVLGSEPEIYFYAQRHSATGYIYTYGLMEAQKFASQMQREMIQEIENAKPEYIVNVIVPVSWLHKANSDNTILNWADRYMAENYRVVGVADIRSTTVYYWDEAAQGYRPPTKYSLYLYRRKI